MLGSTMYRHSSSSSEEITGMLIINEVSKVEIAMIEESDEFRMWKSDW